MLALLKKRIPVIPIVLTVTVVFFVYVPIAEARAEKKANAFCSSIVGTPTAALLDRALAAGADAALTWWHTAQSPTENDTVNVVFTGAFPASMYVCYIEASKESVTKAHRD